MLQTNKFAIERIPIIIIIITNKGGRRCILIFIGSNMILYLGLKIEQNELCGYSEFFYSPLGEDLQSLILLG